jgi:MFS family permease
VDDTGEPEAGTRAAEYRRDAFTWTAFGALGAFGFLNAVLGPALPYLRATEHISYVVGAAHQVAFAVGGGVAGLLATHVTGRPSRAVIIRVGLLGASLAGLGIGYGSHVAVTVVAALFVSLLGTSAVIRLWAALSDAHGQRRTVALAEGEVSVSLGGITAPLLVGGLAATAWSWRFAFVVGTLLVFVAVAVTVAVTVPAEPSGAPEPRVRAGRGPRTGRPPPTLVLVFAVVALEFALSFWLASYLDDSVELGRNLAVSMVAGLYTANLLGRLAASRLARRTTTGTLLGVAIGVSLVGLPILLVATSAGVAAVGVVVAGAGIGAAFPLTSSLHVGSSPRPADAAMGEILAVAAIGQILGPLLAGAIAQPAGLRVGLLVLPALALLAAAALARSAQPGH